MADEIAKLLAKLPPKQLRQLMPVVTQIAVGNFEGLDIKAMKGHHGLFRARVGNLRVIFRLDQKQKPEIISIARRNEKTYKNL